jgi:hypothetical protein
MRTRFQFSYSVSVLPVLAFALVAAAIPGRAQSAVPAPTPDPAPAGSACPVTVTAAQFTRYPTPQPVPAPGATTRDKAYGSLHVEYRNASGKPVRSFDFSAKLAPEKSFRPPLLRIPEDLTHFTQGAPLSANDASHADYPVQANVRDLIWLRLDRVTFADGSSWTPASPSVCIYRPAAKVEPAHPVQTSATE